MSSMLSFKAYPMLAAKVFSLSVSDMTGFKANQSTHDTTISSFGSEMSRISYARVHSCNGNLILARDINSKLE